MESYLWSDGSTEETLFASTEGDYWVSATDSVGCEAIDSSYLSVNPLPVVFLGNDTALCEEGDMLTLEVDNDSILNYSWWLDGTDQNNNFYTYDVYQHTYDQEVIVRVQDLNLCFGYDTIMVQFCGEFFIPNAFTPNGDGTNEEWVIENLNLIEGVTVDVYNRFGDRVFSSVRRRSLSSRLRLFDLPPSIPLYRQNEPRCFEKNR